MLDCHSRSGGPRRKSGESAKPNAEKRLCESNGNLIESPWLANQPYEKRNGIFPGQTPAAYFSIGGVHTH
jgi:hypothetical protein